MATDFWLSKLFFDMKDPQLREQFRADPEGVMDRYDLPEAVRRAVRTTDIPFLAPRVNAYLLRYYCGYIGVPEDQFLSGVRSTEPAEAARNG